MSDFREQVQQSLGSAYTIERELGGGGMSRVFVARDATLRREVVVKVLPPDLVAGVNVERFRREILMAAGLQHPHIVPVLASGEMDGLPWFTMPFVQGESLRDRLARGPLPINESVGILREVAKALAYAHERGVVHRDIKPDNVLLTGGTAVVTDFGIAKALSASRTSEGSTATRGSLTQMGMSIGTPMYMAPEQAAADPDTDARADIYSFGCVAYELLAGRPPFVGMAPQKLLAAHMGERPQNVTELRRDTPPMLAELVMHCLEKEPERRPSSAADVVRLLDTASTTSGNAKATSAVLLRGRVRLRVALAIWAGVFVAAWILAKAAIVGIGLPSWVLPGALIVAALGLPAILFTAFVQRTAHRVLTRTPTLTPGGTHAPQGTMATIAVKAVPHVSWKRTVRGGMLAFGAFVAVVAAFMGMRALGIGPAGSLLASGRINVREPLLVTDFAVKNGDSTLASVVAEAMRSSLSQSNSITLVPTTAVAAALARMQRPESARLDLALARDVARREGIKAIVDGDVTQLGAGYVVAVRLITADSGVTLASVQKAVNGPKELIAAVDMIGRELRGKIGESLRAVQNAPDLEKVTTPSIEALRLYTDGSRAYSIESDHGKAIQLLKQALKIDSGFAMAWRRLGSVYIAAGYPTAAIDSARERAYHFRDRLTTRERLITEQSYFQTGPGQDRVRAAAASEQLLAAGDSSVTGLINYALVLTTRRQYQRAESMLVAANRIGDNHIGFGNLVHLQLGAGELAKAQETLTETIKRFPSPAARAQNAGLQARVYALAGDFDRAERVLDSASATAPASALPAVLGVRLDVALMRGRLAEAGKRFESWVATRKANGVRDIPLADSIAKSYFDITVADRRDRGVQRLDAALAATPFRTLADADRDYFGAASLYARAGRADKARAILAQRLAELRDTARIRNQAPQVHRTMGEIALAEGHPIDAVREFWKGDSLPDGPGDECDACTYVAIARAYDKANTADSAIVYFGKFFASPWSSSFGVNTTELRAPAARRLGELSEAKGDKAKAAHYYQMFVDLWKHADPELQPQVADVKRRLARLGDLERK